MLADVWTGPTINVGVRVGVWVGLVVRVMTDPLARADPMTVVVTDVGVDVLTGASVNVVAAVMTALECTVPASLEE